MAARPPSVLRIIAILAAALACASPLLIPATALADGDPASDVLLGESVFYPYSPAVSASLQKSLNATTAAAKRAGFPIKVALIASAVDLGVIPDLFGKPQKYAEFLDQEISFRGKQPLLVVMPAGYGVQGLGPKATSLVATLPKPTSGQGNALATAAATAVTKLADASGHKLSAAGGTSTNGGSGSGSSSSTTLLAILAAAAVITAGVLGAITIRRRRAGQPR